MARAGKLRHKLRLLQRVETGRDAANEPTYDYTPASPPAWASKRQPGGREFFADGQVQNEITTVFDIRYREDVREDWRVELDGEQYDIRHVTDPAGTRRDLVLACVLRR